MDKANMDWAKDIPCRNVIIYGYCKKEKEGCPFKHESNEPVTATTVVSSTEPTNMASNSTKVIQPLSTTVAMPKFNAKVSASFTPMSVKSTSYSVYDSESNSAETTSPTVQLSKTTANSQLAPLSSGASFTPPTFNPYATESFTPGSTAGNHLNLDLTADDSQGTYGLSHEGESEVSVSAGAIGISNFPNTPPIPDSAHVEFKFPTIYPPPHSLLQYHLYAPDPPPHLRLSLKPNERTPESLFIPNDLREHLVKRNLASLQVFPSGGGIPVIVQDYFGLVPLDFNKSTGRKNTLLGHKNSLYKVFSNLDGKIYLLRRIHDVKALDASHITKTFQAWGKVVCANVVKLKDLFLTTKFGDSSLCAVYDYYPLATSLYETHFVNFPLTPITQEYLWTYLVQLTNAINAVHSKGLSISTLDWDKVIVTGSPGRIKVSGCGPLDVLNFNVTLQQVNAEQQHTFIKLGRLLKDLAANMGPLKDPSIDDLIVEDSFKQVLKYLLDETKMNKNVAEMSQLFYDKILSSIDSALTCTEYTEAVLSRELENGRLFRLMCKLNFIFGRMESRIDINWSESGEKFPIVLFYDYVFHQVDASGKNVIDLTHVLRCLNKLDAGVAEKMVLATPDEMNCIIISYKELKDLIDTTFRLLTQ